MEQISEQRQAMIREQIVNRGITDPCLLEALRVVPREDFIPSSLQTYAYKDSALPIEEEQTISQPYIVALMTEKLELSKTDTVLEIGTGSGYSAAILSQMVKEVYTIERHEKLANKASEILQKLGYTNVFVRIGDGTQGWPEHAPFNAIVVTAGGPKIPETLLNQLAIGGRLVMPVGSNQTFQELILVRKQGLNEYIHEIIDAVRFVPLIGEEGWKESHEEEDTQKESVGPWAQDTIIECIKKEAQPFDDIETCDLSKLLDRIGDAQVVLLGEATHGSSEFYRMRARITQELIAKKGFNIIAIEADWPDAALVHRYICHKPRGSPDIKAFTRFPTWMWANLETHEFVTWLRNHNSKIPHMKDRVGFYGLDLYSMYRSIEVVIEYFNRIDSGLADEARKYYSCLMPWKKDPSRYGLDIALGRYKDCIEETINVLVHLFQDRLTTSNGPDEEYFEALQNAHLVASAERYYRTLYSSLESSWNMRDKHMFETLQHVLSFKGENAKAVIWEHNSHIGNAAGTDMQRHGEFNVGQLCRETFKEKAYLIGFGTYHGKVMAATNWGEKGVVKDIRPAIPESYEWLFHNTYIHSYFLPLRYEHQKKVRQALLQPRLERAIGVIYRPETERISHYIEAILPLQFDEYVWFDATHPVQPLGKQCHEGTLDTYPFGI